MSGGTFVVDAPADLQLIVEFIDGERAEIYDGCNWTTDASYRVDGNTLLVNFSFMTLVGCDVQGESIGDDFRALLTGSPTFVVSDGSLVLRSNDDELVLSETDENPRPYCCRPRDEPTGKRSSMVRSEGGISSLTTCP